MISTLSYQIELAVGIGILLIGTSHVAQPARWGKLFGELLSKEHGPLTIATLSLPLVLLIVIGHPGWTRDARSLVTLYGWLMGIKCVAYLVVPGVAKKMTPARLETGKGFRPVGIVMMVLSVVILHASLTSA